MLTDVGPQPFGRVHGGRCIGIGQQQREFISAIASHEILGAYAFLQEFADVGDQHVAGRMAVRVIDPFEMVDVRQQKGERRAAAPNVCQQRFEPFVHRLAIPHAR